MGNADEKVGSEKSQKMLTKLKKFLVEISGQTWYYCVEVWDSNVLLLCSSTSFKYCDVR